MLIEICLGAINTQGEFVFLGKFFTIYVQNPSPTFSLFT